jgi:hypothetical protein
MLRISILVTGVLLAANSAKALDLDDLTVVTMAIDGSWGVAKAGSQGLAIAAAIRNCQAMAAAPSDCGAQFVTTRGGWVVANLCGDHKIIVAAETREAAEQTALSSEINLKRLYVPEMLPCKLVLVVDPRGVVLLGPAAPFHQTDAQRGKRRPYLFSSRKKVHRR